MRNDEARPNESPPPPEATSEPPSPVSPPSPLRRVVFRAAGLFFVGLGVVGIALPGLPTVIFLIVAAWFLDRSDPALRQRLMSTPLLAPYRRWVEGRAPIPTRVKVRAIVVVWIVVTISIALSLRREDASPIIPIVIATGALIGTVTILRYRAPHRTPGGDSAASEIDEDSP